jgi:DNA-binding HxlR family transcriptional regulator
MTKVQFNCPAELTIHLIGGKWKIIVLWLLRKGPQRSGKLKSRLSGITATAFSNAVRDLEASGLIKRKIKDVYPLEVSYELTPKGESLSPIVKSIFKWGLAHRSDYQAGKFEMEKFYS